MNASDQQGIALVVDDTPETLGMVSTVLEENGITVLVARDGPTALDLAARVRPDVILMDAVMPGMDGFETCRRLKEAPGGTMAPIIFMTGLTEPSHIVRALESGGVDYVRKPVVIEELLARITTHVLNAKMIRSAREALDTSGRALAAFEAGGRLAWATPEAQARLDAIAGLAADQAFRLWLRDCLARAVSDVPAFETPEARLVFIGLTSTRDVLARLVPAGAETPVRQLCAAFGLTTREGEVLYWLSFGKTNRDIAQILGLSNRTVNKHLEQVFQKMGVDNRTAAAVRAERTISN